MLTTILISAIINSNNQIDQSIYISKREAKVCFCNEFSTILLDEYEKKHNKRSKLYKGCSYRRLCNNLVNSRNIKAEWKRIIRKDLLFSSNKTIHKLELTSQKYGIVLK